LRCAESGSTRRREARNRPHLGTPGRQAVTNLAPKRVWFACRSVAVPAVLSTNVMRSRRRRRQDSGAPPAPADAGTDAAERPAFAGLNCHQTDFAESPDVLSLWSVARPLRCRDGRSIARHDLWLERKHLAGAIIDQDLQPVHVVISVGLV